MRLDNYKDLMRGGGTGPAVVPENLDESLTSRLALRRRRIANASEQKLADEVVDDFVKWIEMGAPHPDASKTKIEPRQDAVDWEKERNFWSFQPISDPEIPELTKPHSNWATNSLDPHPKQLQQQGLTPPLQQTKCSNPSCHFCTNGTSPTPEEYRPSAPLRKCLPQLIDRLLDSSAYGERWGRFWLDVVRYADSNGLDENIAHGNAWRYRDYVIQAFNDDIPFDEFIVEQIAGDLLPAAEDIALTNRRLVATGFLVLGPKVLAEGESKN